MSYIMFTSFLSSLVMSVSFLLSKKMTLYKEKTSPFECGFDPYMMTRTPFSLRFFKLSVIFLIFDIEIVLILPLPLMTNMSTMSNNSFFFILLVILSGLLYEWNEGSLNWMK